MASKDTSVSDGQAAVLENHRLNCSLDQIRLIQLDPKADTESQSSIITASIGIFPLNNTVPYIALSYVWGTDEPPNTIMLDGQPMRVRNNLWNFLDTFCREGNASYLWIDALCINQSYTPERNHQVTLMGQIYSQATKVIAWLGMDPDLVREAEDLAGAGRTSRAHPVFSNADYWHRAWIQQEFILAKEVEIRCGKVTLSTEFVNNMLTARGLIAALFMTYRLRIGQTLRFRRNRLEGGPFYDISEIMDLTYQNAGRLECSDPKDQVYAFLGLIDKETLRRYPINVDYNISNFQMYEVLAARHEKMESDGWLKKTSPGPLHGTPTLVRLKRVLGCT
ncbi:hypothetical protein E8E13_002780 [Curvularia kusanoi]|uniref:Heterokaryon incompatibility domain-containing protein n=1 Tax=Curvularia kusanoi TaxID=90978 RepID=A0A9P4WAT4_CURKU|nr:hypothetical protein E8E13_002780 [Curvularia kusanoi]